MQQLHEQYRPTSWSEVIGQGKVLAKLDALRRRGLCGRSFWLSGQSGTGKTTIARLIAAEVASDWCTEEVDATDLSAARVRELERQSVCRGLGKGGRAYIINESHGLTRGVVRQLLTTLERIPSHVVWCFTTTVEGEQALFDGIDDVQPLLSRCVNLPLSRRALSQPFAERARMIAQAEGLDGQPIEAYLKLMKQCKNNLRQALVTIEAGGMLS